MDNYWWELTEEDSIRYVGKPAKEMAEILIKDLIDAGMTEQNAIRASKIGDTYFILYPDIRFIHDNEEPGKITEGGKTFLKRFSYCFGDPVKEEEFIKYLYRD